MLGDAHVERSPPAVGPSARTAWWFRKRRTLSSIARRLEEPPFHLLLS
jgi:hypothetical protein